MAKKLVNVVAKLRQRGKKDQQPKLLCDIKWLKLVVTFFFGGGGGGNAINLGRSDDAKRRKKGDGLKGLKINKARHCFSYLQQ